MRRNIILYIPVLHKGYTDFLDKYVGSADSIYVIGDYLLSSMKEFDYLNRKDRLRAVESNQMIQVLKTLYGDLVSVELLNEKSLSFLQASDVSLVMPNEDICTDVYEHYFSGKDVLFDSVFLRWHRNNVLENKKVEVHKTLSCSQFEKEIMKQVFLEAGKSADWWRQVAAFIVKDGEVILIAHNCHVPDEQTPYVFGDPRSIFKRGIHLELSTAEHAEARLIAEAARRGISLEGAELFVTDFPCPPCAKLVARSGIKKCYFSRGYAVLDGEDVLKEKKVELIFVET